MGTPMDRSNRPFAPLTASFEEAFPTLEDAVIRYTEYDFGTKLTTRIDRLRRDGGLIRCRKPRCFDGGFEWDKEVSSMIRQGHPEKEIDIYCPGHEGTAKRRRGSSCTRSIRGKITLEFKSAK